MTQRPPEPATTPHHPPRSANPRHVGALQLQFGAQDDGRGRTVQVPPRTPTRSTPATCDASWSSAAPGQLRRGCLVGGVVQMSTICSHTHSIELTELPEVI